jgi:hypothetical protein
MRGHFGQGLTASQQFTTGAISRLLTSSAGVLSMVVRIIALPLIAGTMN